MANLIFAYQDLSRYSLTATSTDGNYPLTNLQSYYPNQQWKSASLTGAQTLVIDFGSATSCDFLVLDNYWFGNADDVRLEAANDSGFSPGLVTPITTGIIGTGLELIPAYFSFSAVSKRYWRLRTTLAAGSLAAPPQVGNLYLGAKLDFGQTYSYPYGNNAPKYKTNEAEALDGRIRMSQAIAGRSIWKFDITHVSDAVRSSFQTMYRTVRGKLRPFYLIDVDGLSYSLVNFDFDADNSETQTYNVNHIKKIVLKEVFTS